MYHMDEFLRFSREDFQDSIDLSSIEFAIHHPTLFGDSIDRLSGCFEFVHMPHHGQVKTVHTVQFELHSTSRAMSFERHGWSAP